MARYIASPPVKSVPPSNDVVRSSVKFLSSILESGSRITLYRATTRLFVPGWKPIICTPRIAAEFAERCRSFVKSCQLNKRWKWNIWNIVFCFYWIKSPRFSSSGIVGQIQAIWKLERYYSSHNVLLTIVSPSIQLLLKVRTHVQCHILNCSFFTLSSS